MIVWLIVGIGLAFLLLMLLGWWSRADVKTAKSTLFWAIVAVCGVITLALFASGRGFAAILPIGFTAWKLFGARGKAGVRPSGQSGARQNGGGNGRMSVSEAREVLGVSDHAGDAEINTAYRKLMAKYHPDKGGNDWMAAKLNEARRTLIGDK